MDAELSRRGMLDGAWWPRSRDASTELPELLELLGTRLGVITRLALNTHDWDGNPRRLTVGGRDVRVGWFHGALRASVSVTTREHDRFELLVVPPRTAEAKARTAMRTAAAAVGNTSTAGAILATIESPDRVVVGLAGPNPS